MAHTNIIISLALLLTDYPALQSLTIDNQALSPNPLRSSKNGMHDLQNELNSKWPTGKIHYYTNVSSYDYFIAYRLRMIMNMIETVSCLEFEALMVIPNTTSDINWIHFMNPRRERECVHNVDFSEKEIVVVLGYDCLSEAEILHSLMHGIGFKDEVTHPLRDKYIRVLWNNIQFAYQSLYYLRYEDKTAALVEYDPLSVMHFADRDFSINGRATIEPVVGGLTISPSRGLSQLDKLKLNLYFSYACNKREVKKILKTCKNTLHKEVDSKENKDELGKSREDKIETFAGVSKENTLEENKNVLHGQTVSGAEDGANNNMHTFGGVGADTETNADSSAGVGGGTGSNRISHKDIGVDSSAGADGGTLLIGMADKGTSGDDSADADGGANDENNPAEDDGTLSSGKADKSASGDESAVADDGASDESNPDSDGGTLLSGMTNKDTGADSSSRADGGTILISVADKGASGDDSAGVDGGTDKDKGSDSGVGTSVEGSDGGDSDVDNEADKTEGASALRHNKYKKHDNKIKKST